MWGQKWGWLQGPPSPPSTLQLGAAMGSAWGQGMCRSAAGSLLVPARPAPLGKLPLTPSTAAAFVGSG